MFRQTDDIQAKNKIQLHQWMGSNYFAYFNFAYRGLLKRQKRILIFAARDRNVAIVSFLQLLCNTWNSFENNLPQNCDWDQLLMTDWLVWSYLDVNESENTIQMLVIENTMHNFVKTNFIKKKRKSKSMSIKWFNYSLVTDPSNSIFLESGFKLSKI